MISAINLFKNNSIGNINFLARGRKSSDTTDYSKYGYTKVTGTDKYISRTVSNGIVIDSTTTKPAMKRAVERYEAVMNPNNEDGSVTLVDSKGNETKLSRPLTLAEAKKSNAQGILFKNEKLQTLVEFLDMGMDEDIAYSIVSGSDKSLLKFKQLITPNEDGRCIIQDKNGEDIVLSRPLEPKEAFNIIRARSKKISDENIELFIQLKDTEGLDDIKAFNLAHAPKLADKYYSLTSPNSDGSVTLKDKDDSETVLYRALTKEEAYPVLELANDRLPAYLKILDMGVEPYDANDIALNLQRSKRFFALTQEDESGRVVLTNKNGEETVLKRPLKADEALIAMKEHFANQKIQEQLEQKGKITSTRRNYNRLA